MVNAKGRFFVGEYVLGRSALPPTSAITVEIVMSINYNEVQKKSVIKDVSNSNRALRQPVEEFDKHWQAQNDRLVVYKLASAAILTIVAIALVLRFA